MKRFLSVLLLLSLLIGLSACQKVGPSEDVLQPGNAKAITFTPIKDDQTAFTVEAKSPLVYMGMEDGKLLYMTLENEVASYYVYDFLASKNYTLGVNPKVTLQSNSIVLQDGKAYFYVSEDDGKKNVLYEADLNGKTIEPLSENNYSQQLIPLTWYKDTLWAVPSDVSGNGKKVQVFLQQGTDKTSLRKTFSGKAKDKNIRAPLVLAGAEDALYAIEEQMTKGDPEYYLVSYTDKLEVKTELDITSIFRGQDTTDSLVSMDVFGNYFCMKDTLGHQVVAELQTGNVIFCGQVVEHMVDPKDDRYAYFYEYATNNLYFMNLQINEWNQTSLGVDAEDSTIRCAFKSGDTWVVVKSDKIDSAKETIYFVDGTKEPATDEKA